MSLDQFLDKPSAQLEDGVGLALSGGGFRAMVFHVGALIRLNEVALLRKVKRIPSVSGGSITEGGIGNKLEGPQVHGRCRVEFRDRRRPGQEDGRHVGRRWRDHWRYSAPGVDQR
jgi:predicted acylesterase/phospholipase RssA